MPLSDNESLAISAQITYDTSREKITYINGKLGYLDEEGSVLKKFKKVAWTNNTFYRCLQKIDKHTMERLFENAKRFKEDTLNDMELLLEIKRGKLQMLQITKSKGLYSIANQLGDSVVTMLPYISSLREAIKVVMEDDVKRYEREIEEKQRNLAPPVVPRTT